MVPDRPFTPCRGGGPEEPATRDDGDAGLVPPRPGRPAGGVASLPRQRSAPVPASRPAGARGDSAAGPAIGPAPHGDRSAGPGRGRGPAARGGAPPGRRGTMRPLWPIASADSPSSVSWETSRCSTRVPALADHGWATAVAAEVGAASVGGLGGWGVEHDAETLIPPDNL
jgi:hypothetical protein